MPQDFTIFTMFDRLRAVGEVEILEPGAARP